MLLALRLAEFRKAMKLDQSSVKGFSQPAVSKIEARGDIKLSTLVEYCHGLGAELEIATFELPINYDVLTNLGSLLLYIDPTPEEDSDEGCNVGQLECNRATNGNWTAIAQRNDIGRCAADIHEHGIANRSKPAGKSCER